MRTKSNKPTKRELLKMQKEAEEKLLAELKIEYNKSYDSILEDDKYDALLEQMYDEKISEGAELAEYQSNMNQFDRYKIPAKILKLANRCTDLLVDKLQNQCEEEIKKQIYFKAETIMKAGRVEQYEKAAKYYGGQKGSILKAINGTTSYNEALRNQYIIMKAREELPISDKEAEVKDDQINNNNKNQIESSKNKKYKPKIKNIEKII